MKTIGFVSGSFDPITKGHIWLINHALPLCDELVVVVATNANKTHMFSTDERLSLTKRAVFAENPAVRVVALGDQLLTDFIRSYNAFGEYTKVMFRGIRNSTDYAYEHELMTINKELCSSVETVFLCPPADLVAVSSTTLRSIIGSDKFFNSVPKKFLTDRIPDEIYAEVCKKRD